MILELVKPGDKVCYKICYNLIQRKDDVSQYHVQSPSNLSTSEELGRDSKQMFECYDFY